MLKLFKITYTQKGNFTGPITKYVKALTRSEAINECMPLDEIGDELVIDNISIDYLCDVDSIAHCTSAG